MFKNRPFALPTIIFAAMIAAVTIAFLGPFTFSGKSELYLGSLIFTFGLIYFLVTAFQYLKKRQRGAGILRVSILFFCLPVAFILFSTMYGLLPGSYVDTDQVKIVAEGIFDGEKITLLQMTSGYEDKVDYILLYKGEIAYGSDGEVLSEPILQEPIDYQLNEQDLPTNSVDSIDLELEKQRVMIRFDNGAEQEIDIYGI